MPRFDPRQSPFDGGSHVGRFVFQQQRGRACFFRKGDEFRNVGADDDKDLIDGFPQRSHDLFDDRAIA